MVLAAATLLGGATRLPAAVQRPDLSGHWTYNPAQSDNPRSMMQRRDSVGGDRPGGDRPGGFGGGRGGFGGGRAPAALTIVASDSGLTFTSDTGAALVLYGDGRKLKQSVEGGGDVEIKAHWQGNDFVVERKVSGGGKVTEDYLRSQDGKQLYVIVSVDGGRGRTSDFRRVYDAAASTPQPQ